MISVYLVLMLGWTVGVSLQDESLVTTVAVPDLTTSFNPVPPAVGDKTDQLEVYSVHVISHIQYRYASTIVSSRVANKGNSSQEVVFSVVIPETAFISGFLMEIDGKVYKASVKEKEEAKKEYDEAIQRGQTAGHVAQSARDSNRFTVSVNVESQKKVTFNITYEELLKRELSMYNLVINIDPGQIVKDMAVDVNINESSPITSLEVTNLRESNEIDNDKHSNNPLAEIKRPSSNTATIRWAPSAEDQRKLNEEGVKGQIIVRYDVDRTLHPEQILVNEGYFVHFFSPPNLSTLPKHVTFVIDVSGSMYGRKIEQLREAMKIILGDLNKGDYFSIVIFSDEAQVWDPDHELVVSSLNPLALKPEQNKTAVSDAAVVPATPDNIKKAQDFVKDLQTYSATNIYDGLLRGLELAHLGKKLTASGDDKSKPQPIIIFLTDGVANVGESDPEKIVGIVTDKNGEDGVSIFALEFGDYANSKFLKKLALRNSGFSRKIYEASDSALQLRDFYHAVSSPLLANVTFNYPEDQVEERTLSRTNFPTFFSGSELVVVGKLKSSELAGHLTAKTSNGTTSMAFLPPIHVPFPDWDLAAQLRPERNYSDASFMERLWSYLTIKQLLEKETTETLEGSNVTSPSKQKALDLALKYGFVTPVTSLVVVKPNETVSTDTEKGDVEAFGFGNRFSLAAPQAAFAGGGFSRPAFLSAAGGASAAGGYGGIPLPASPYWPPPPPPPTRPPRPLSTSYTTTILPFHTSTPVLLEVVPVQNLTWLSAVSNSSHITLQPDPSSSAETFQLGLNQTDEEFSSCISPEGAGHCRYLRHCSLNVFADSIDIYYSYLCKIDNYAGVCCPDWIKPVSVAK